jgi:hypothetical protein
MAVPQERIQRVVIDSTFQAFVTYFTRSPCGTGRSNLTWQISSGIGYQTPWSDVSLTYRYLSFEQGSSAAVQHLWVEGPMIMANLKF